MHRGRAQTATLSAGCRALVSQRNAAQASDTVGQTGDSGATSHTAPVMKPDKDRAPDAGMESGVAVAVQATVAGVEG